MMALVGPHWHPTSVGLHPAAVIALERQEVCDGRFGLVVALQKLPRKAALLISQLSWLDVTYSAGGDAREVLGDGGAGNSEDESGLHVVRGQRLRVDSDRVVVIMITMGFGVQVRQVTIVEDGLQLLSMRYGEDAVRCVEVGRWKGSGQELHWALLFKQLMPLGPQLVQSSGSLPAHPLDPLWPSQSGGLM